MAMEPTNYTPNPLVHIEEHFVPMPEYSSTGYYNPTIICFNPESSEHLEYSYNGIPLLDCLADIGLSNPDMPVLQDEIRKGRERIRFVLKWPGYEHIIWEDDISIIGPYGNPITLRELAFLIAKQFRDFVAKCDEFDIGCTEPEWRVGVNGYDIPSMCLSSMWNPADGVWQASIRVQSVVDW